MPSVAAPASPLAARAADVASLAKPRLATLVLVTTAGGAWLAGGAPPTRLATTVLGTAMVVAGANALNNWYERDTDRLMARTRDRPLPAGRMRPATALAVGLALGLGALPVLALGAHPVAALLGALGLVVYAGVYTPMKRLAPAATLVGGLAGALPPLIGWVGASGRLDAGGLALFGLLFAWQVPHSLAIALFRTADYRRAGIAVLPVVRGPGAARFQVLLWCLPLVVAPAALARLGVGGPLSLVGGTAAGVAVTLLALDLWAHARGPRHARRLFFASLGQLVVLFALLAADRALFPG